MRPKHVAVTAFIEGLFLPAARQAQDWHLIWSGDFDHTGVPDDTRLDYDVGGHGRGNQQSQYYTRDRIRNARVASRAVGGKFALEMGGVNIAEDISLPSTSGWQYWVTVRKEDVHLNEGQGILRLRFRACDFNVNKLIFTLVRVTDTNKDTVPESFDLSANYPNPFGSETRITYTIPRTTTVTLDLYNALGQHATTLANGMHQPERYHISVDGRSLPQRVYSYRLHTPGAYRMRVMTRLP